PGLPSARRSCRNGTLAGGNGRAGLKLGIDGFFAGRQHAACSQGRVKLPTGGMQRVAASPRAPSGGRVSRSGAMPEPTVRVRMKENARARLPMRLGALVIALGDVSVTGKEITVTHTRYAFVKADCHAEIVGRREAAARALLIRNTHAVPAASSRRDAARSRNPDEYEAHKSAPKP
ncbi:hypothetical protein KXV85_003563, partial [Aspergillus fumigatus]